MDKLEITAEANWLNTHVDTERANLVRQLFPFRPPPLDVARNCLIIDDPNIQLQSAFHDTSSSIFLSPRKDRKILVPAIAFENQPALNLWVMVSDTLPKTHEVTNRRWATWCGRNILQSIPTNLLSFTPESGVKVLEQSRKAKEIYRQLLTGKDQDREGLRQIMRNLGIAGGWLKYYAEEIPQKAINEPIKISESVNQIFSGLEEKIENAEAKFRELSSEDQGLLSNPFRVTIKARFQKPYAYFSEKVDAIRRNSQHTLADEPFVRDPLEIVGRTQGVSFDEVETIFLPDDLDTSEAKIVKGRISEMGLSDRVKSASEISGVEKYETCDLRYKRFTPNLLAQYIEEGRFKPLVPTEWKETKCIIKTKAIAEQSKNRARKKIIPQKSGDKLQRGELSNLFKNAHMLRSDK